MRCTSPNNSSSERAARPLGGGVRFAWVAFLLRRGFGLRFVLVRSCIRGFLVQYACTTLIAFEISAGLMETLSPRCWSQSQLLTLRARFDPATLIVRSTACPFAMLGEPFLRHFIHNAKAVNASTMAGTECRPRGGKFFVKASQVRASRWRKGGSSEGARAASTVVAGIPSSRARREDALCWLESWMSGMSDDSWPGASMFVVSPVAIHASTFCQRTGSSVLATSTFSA